jgi:predicted aspartyl protease
LAIHCSPRPDPKDLEKYGPRIEVEIGPPILHDRTQPRSRFFPVAALIDTGAARTVFTPEAVQQLGLPVVDYTILSRVGGEERFSVHVASIQFPRYKMASVEAVPVACCQLPGGLFQCLIGRDILRRWLFTYNGKTGEWCIQEEDRSGWIEPPEGLWF